jgi:hypothetical protein
MTASFQLISNYSFTDHLQHSTLRIRELDSLVNKPRIKQLIILRTNTPDGNSGLMCALKAAGGAESLVLLALKFRKAGV